MNRPATLHLTEHKPEGATDRGGDTGPSRRRGLLAVGAILLTLIAMALAWRYTALHDLVKIDRLTEATRQLRGTWTGLLVGVGGFIVGALVVLPLNLLIVVVVIGFGAWPGALYAYLGGLLSALLTYWIGRRLAGARLTRLLGARGERVRRAFVDRSIPSIAVFRVTPTAPFTIINVIFGALGITLLDYTVGTALGLIPGILAMALVGDRLVAVLREPTLVGVAVLMGVILTMAVLGWLAQLIIHRRRSREAGRVEESD